MIEVSAISEVISACLTFIRELWALLYGLQISKYHNYVTVYPFQLSDAITSYTDIKSDQSTVSLSGHLVLNHTSIYHTIP